MSLSDLALGHLPAKNNTPPPLDHRLQVHADVILTARMLISLRAMGNQDVVETGNSLAIRMYARSYLRDPVTSELHFRSQGCQLTSDNGSLSQPYEPITLDHALDIRR